MIQTEKLAHYVVRDMREGDDAVLAHAFYEQNWQQFLPRYRTYFAESCQGLRTVLLAEAQEQCVGYLTIVWVSGYPPFQAAQIPEIVDFDVLFKFRRRGVGTRLMDEAERRVSLRSDQVGLGVGLTWDYGAAQILYSKRGYVPDGRGLFQQGKYLNYGEQLCIDDTLVLYLTKRLEAVPSRAF